MSRGVICRDFPRKYNIGAAYSPEICKNSVRVMQNGAGKANQKRMIVRKRIPKLRPSPSIILFYLYKNNKE